MVVITDEIKNFSSEQKLGFVATVSLAEVTSPLYDLGYTQEEIISKWKKHYLSF